MSSHIKTALVAAAMLGAATGLALAGDAPNTAWPMSGHDYANQRYSALSEINGSNVGGLKLAYTLQLGSLRSNEMTPLVIGDTMFVSTSWGPKFVYALDARTGVLKWRYEPDIPDDVLQYGCCDVNSRGVAYADGKLFVGRLDGKLVALDAATGKEIWTANVVDYKQGSVITSPPLVVKNLVITGFGGGEYGARGYLSAYDAASGKLLWKTWTVPGPGEAGNDSWKGDSWQHGGGAPWLVGSYDPKTNTVFWGTSNPSPWNSIVRSTGNGDYGRLRNLYTASTLALDADTGHIKWYVQSTPEDAWDYDGVNEIVLADLAMQDGTTPVYMKADRNGFFYVVNRETGKVLSAEKFVPTNWAERIDLATATPVEVADKRPGPNHPAKDICPNLLGGKNWQPMSFDPHTKLVYLTANNLCMTAKEEKVKYHRGLMYLGINPAKVYAGPGGYQGQLIAWNPVEQKAEWSIKEPLWYNGGVLTTGGGLVFYGTFDGWFKAVDARSGKVLWKFNVGSGVGAAPMTYMIDGKQYVALVVGRSVTEPDWLGAFGAQSVAKTSQAGELFVFALGK